MPEPTHPPLALSASLGGLVERAAGAVSALAHMAGW
jgi:hypothetical protein